MYGFILTFGQVGFLVHRIGCRCYRSEVGHDQDHQVVDLYIKDGLEEDLGVMEGLVLVVH